MFCAGGAAAAHSSAMFCDGGTRHLPIRVPEREELRFPEEVRGQDDCVSCLSPPLPHDGPAFHLTGQTHLSSVVGVCRCLHTDKEYPEEHVAFVTQHNIALHMFDTEENKAQLQTRPIVLLGLRFHTRAPLSISLLFVVTS